MTSSLTLPMALVAFRGFGSGRHACITGRVVVGSSVAATEPHGAGDASGLLARLGRGLSLAISPRVPDARVRVHCAGQAFDLDADGHGYFSRCLRLSTPLGESPWSSYRVELLNPEPAEPVSVEGQILNPPASARRLVVSDIDDTVMYTGVANKLRMLWRLFAKPAQERRPFPGVDALYRGLHGGPDGADGNPIVYVSRSPWSLYPTLDAFFEHHRIPIGPVLQLRDWGISLRHPLPRRAESHKWDLIEQMLEVFETLPVVLIGDSGQRDPEVYAALARKHPGRIAAIYIRDLEHSSRRSRALQRLARRLARDDVALVASPSTEGIAVDARDRGWLPPETLAEMRGEAAREET